MRRHRRTSLPDGADGFLLRNHSTGLCLDARDGATTDWSVVQQWTYFYQALWPR